MTTRETGILNPVPAARWEVDRNFDAYTTAFRHTADERGVSIQEARRQSIETMAFTPYTPFHFATYKSRIPLAAHWAENDGAAYKRATDIYDMHATTTRFRGQALLRFIHGSYVDLDPNSTAKLAIEVSRLQVTPRISHGIQPATAEHVPAGFDDLPFAHYGSSIFTSPMRHIIRRREGNLSVRKLRAGARFVRAIEGVTSVDADIDTFWDTASETQTTLLFGNREVHRALEKLTGERIRRRLFDRRKRMPDLGFLATSQSASASVVEDRTLADVLQDIGALVD